MEPKSSDTRAVHQAKKRRPFWHPGLFTRNNLRNFGLIAQREYKVRVFRRPFIISTGISMLGVLIASLLPTLFQLRGVETTQQVEKAVVVFAPADLLGEQSLVSYLNHALGSTPIDSDLTANQLSSYLANSGLDYTFRWANPDEAKADLRKKIKDGKLGGYIEAKRTDEGELDLKYYNGYNTPYSLDNTIQTALRKLVLSDRLSRLGLSAEQIDKAAAPINVETSTVELLADESEANQSNNSEQDSTNGPDTTSGAIADDSTNNATTKPPRSRIALVIPLILGFMLFASVFAYGQLVGQGAAEEKSTRIIELMISAATPFQLMLGKIIGIALVGATQLGLVGAAGLVGLLLQVPIILFFAARGMPITPAGSSSVLSQVSNSPIGTAINSQLSGNASVVQTLSIPIVALLFFPIFYILGFFMWATLYAAAGSLVSRQEDVQIALTPVMGLTGLNYLPLMLSLVNFNAPWVTICSYIPLFAPSMMIARLAYGNAAWWEGLLVILILLVSIVLCTWLSARVYRAGVLMYGTKPTFRRFIKLMISNKA
jgi:ABC-2 type transport system permease protein